jgi:uncharacterized protein (TIGR02266 family)
MSVKTILIAHKSPAVRDRFAVALADARHNSVSADSEAGAVRALETGRVPIDLALVDLSLAAEPLRFVRALVARARPAMPVMVFSGSLASAAEIPALAALNVNYINEYAGTPQILPALAPLLFPDNFNRRVSVRAAVGVPVTYRTDETLTGAVTLDVGKGGLAIRTMNPLPKGTIVQVKFRLPGALAEIDASGHVAWSDRKVGMGVQFDRLSSSQQRALDGFVESHG